MTHKLTLSFMPELPQARLSAEVDPALSDEQATGAPMTRILGTAFAVGLPSGPSMDGNRYRFAGLPDNADELLDVVNEHDGWADPIGRMTEPFKLDDTGQLAAGVARIFDTQAGRDALVLASEGVKGGFSVAAEFDSFTEADDGVRDVPSWRAAHLGLVRSPAFTESRGLTLAASAANPNQERSTMPPTAGPAVVELPTIDELTEQVSARLSAAAKAPTHPLAAYPSAAAFFAAFQNADEDTRQRMSAEFAVGVQVTENNPGVMLPTWRQTVVANLEKRRPAISLFGTTGMPDSGMDASWPYFDGDLDALVQRQVAELDQLTGMRIDIKRATAGILTAGVASTISYQLLLRASPSYMAAHDAITSAAWYRYTEAVFAAAVAAASTELAPGGSSLPAIAAGAKPTAYKSALFEASMAVQDATGAPAEFVLCSRDVFVELGGADLPNPENASGGGTPGASGTASASNLRVNVNGLEHYYEPFLTGEQVIVSNSTAAKFPETGPMVATQDQVTKLGQDVATWGMYIPAEVYFPAGIVRLDRTA